jgi:hypothetical protein
VTKICQVVEYITVQRFRKLGEQISDTRRAGDADPNKKILAETNKLTGNSMQRIWKNTGKLPSVTNIMFLDASTTHFIVNVIN